MAVQKREVVAVGLGVTEDVPVTSEQPPLVRGIHLRYAVPPTSGFPWHGFYVFRRRSLPGTPEWLNLAGLGAPVGPWPGAVFETPQGRLSSDRSFVFTDDFPPAGTVEVDLAARAFVRFTAHANAVLRRAEVILGFRRHPDEPTPARAGVDFGGYHPAAGPNPRTEQGMTFVDLQNDGEPRPNTHIARKTIGDSSVTGLECKWGLDVTLPLQATYVEVTLSRFQLGGGADEDNHWISIAAFEQSGAPAESAKLGVPEQARTDTVRLFGSALRRLEIRTSGPELLINAIWCGDARLTRIRVTALHEAVPVAETVVTGYAGLVTAGSVGFDGFTVIQLGAGHAALVGLGWVPVEQGATLGWAQIPGLALPIRLPVAHPEYPCTPGAAESLSAARTLARQRILYGNPDDFAAAPVVRERRGTVTVAQGSPVVLGSGTHWDAGAASAVFSVEGDDTAYGIVRVLGPEKLVLSRAYQGASRAAAPYVLADDPFAQLHDQLVSLVAGGPAGGAMAERRLPAPISTAGNVSVSRGSAVVTGAGTSWGSELAGLSFQVQGDTTRYTIAAVESAARLRLDRAYLGESAGEKVCQITSSFQSAGGGPDAPAQRPLDLALLASSSPAVAQMLGLYYVDRSAAARQSYDYLVIADHGGVATLDPAKLLAMIGTSGFQNVDGYIVHDRRLARPEPLPRPDGLRVYALPGINPVGAGSAAEDVSNNVGLRWNPNRTEGGVLLPGGAILYHVFRARLGNAEAPTSDQPYELITRGRPAIPAESREPRPPALRGWPPFALDAIDGRLPEGWYGYRASGVDIFGRYSALSDPGAWHQWAPPPDPRPWYYRDPPGDTELHPSAVLLLTKTAPPPPLGVEAHALDPADPTILADARYTAWWTELTGSAWYQALTEEQQRNLVGLRVRWRWTEDARAQAPATQEFRIYLQLGPLNARLGRTASVVATSQTESEVTTDLPNAAPAGSYGGGWLRIGQDAFPITDSQAGSPLTVRVRNVGIDAEILPRVHAPCAVTTSRFYTIGTVGVTTGSPVVEGAGTRWNASLVGMPFRIVSEDARYTVTEVSSPSSLTLDRPYGGTTAEELRYTVRHPLWTDLGAPAQWQARFHVVDAERHWTPIVDSQGRPARQYDVLLPEPGGPPREGLPLFPTLEDPIAYAQIGVSAADRRPHTPDHPKWSAGSWGGRPGNEGPVGAPVTIFRVRRDAPPGPAPVPPSRPEPLFATLVDVNGRSFYTHRWRPSPHLKTHLFRALDQAVFQVDWSLRPRAPLSGSQLELFPDQAAEPRWNAAKRDEVAQALNQLDTFNRATPEGQAAAMAHYRGLSDDALRVLAGLPGNERAFTQLAAAPLDPADASTADRVGPDDPETYVPGLDRRAFVDTLAGLAAGRFVYRELYVDAAQNRGPLGLSGPPVHVRSVIAPRAPRITRAVAGDAEIRLSWISNREVDLLEYRVFRADSEDAARDLRTMEQVAVVPADPDPTARPAEVAWTDGPVEGLMDRWYRVVAVARPDPLRPHEGSLRASPPSSTARARPYNQTPPVPPEITELAWVRIDPGGAVHPWSEAVPPGEAWEPAVRLRWAPPPAGHRLLVQGKRDSEAGFGPASGWLPPTTTAFIHRTTNTFEGNSYRLRVVSAAGNANAVYQTVRLAPVS